MGEEAIGGFLPHIYCLLVAAAADEKESDNKDPDPVAIEKSAKAVCHDKFLREIGIKIEK